jgi:hypothetical protein
MGCDGGGEGEAKEVPAGHVRRERRAEEGSALGIMRQGRPLRNRMAKSQRFPQ